MPALPLHEAGKYVAAAYIVVFALVLVYVAIMATRLSRVERELGELLRIPERTDHENSQQQAQADLDVGRPESTPV
jgi:CcmD family protein